MTTADSGLQRGATWRQAVVIATSIVAGAAAAAATESYH